MSERANARSRKMSAGPMVAPSAVPILTVVYPGTSILSSHPRGHVSDELPHCDVRRRGRAKTLGNLPIYRSCDFLQGCGFGPPLRTMGRFVAAFFGCSAARPAALVSITNTPPAGGIKRLVTKLWQAFSHPVWSRTMDTTPSGLARIAGVILAMAAIIFHFSPYGASTSWGFWLMGLAYLVGAFRSRNDPAKSTTLAAKGTLKPLLASLRGFAILQYQSPVRPERSLRLLGQVRGRCNRRSEVRARIN
jgi:hypothetical protein